MKKIVSVIAFICFSSSTFVFALTGSGSEADPYLIQSLVDFDEFVADPNYWDDYTRLETDVNMAGRTYTTAIIAPKTYEGYFGFGGIPFTGVFDGNNHKIIHLTIINDGGIGNDYVGVFGYTLAAQWPTSGFLLLLKLPAIGFAIALALGALGEFGPAQVLAALAMLGWRKRTIPVSVKKTL